MTKQRLLQVLQITLTLSLVIFIALKAQIFLDEVEWSKIPAVWPNIVLAAVFFAMGFCVLSHHWLLVAREIIPGITSRQRLAFFASQPYKYLPTSIFTLSFRALYAKKLGMSVGDSSKAQVIENLNIVGAAFVLASITWVMALNLTNGLILVALLGIIFAILWKNHHINIRIYKTKTVLHMRCWIKAFLLAMSAWFLVGVGFFCLATGLQENVSILNAIAATGYAFGAGILAVFAPGGIGVREVIFSSFGFVASTILVWRCITFVIDIVLGTISIWLIERSHR